MAVNKVSYKKFLTQNVMSFGLVGIINKSLSLLLFPLYIRSLSLDDFGQLDLITSSLSVGVVLFGLGMDQGYMQIFFQINKKDRSKLFSNFIIAVTSIFLIITVILFLLSFINLTIKTILQTPLYLFTIIIVPLSLFNSAILTNLKNNFKQKTFVFVSISGLFLKLVATYFFLIKLQYGLFGVILSLAAAEFCQLFVGALIIRNDFTFKISRYLIKDLIMKGVNYLPTTISVWIIMHSSRFILNHYVGPSSVGELGIVNRISNGTYLIVSAFIAAWKPYGQSLLIKNSYNKSITDNFYLGLNFISLSVCFGISLYANEIIGLLAGKEYIYLSDSTFFYSLFFAFWAIINFKSVYFSSFNETKYLSYSSFHSSVISLLASIILVPLYGLLGAILSMLLAYIFATLYLNHKLKLLFKSSVNLKIFFIGIVYFYVILLLVKYLVAINNDKGFIIILFFKSIIFVITILLALKLLYPKLYLFIKNEKFPK